MFICIVLILESATDEVHDEIGDSHAHAIDETVAYEQTIGVSRWLLRNKLLRNAKATRPRQRRHPR